MPYISPEDRRRLALGGIVTTPGELNYRVHQLVFRYLPNRPHYADFNEVIGVLECVKQELYRRMVAAYEDEKRAEHGDVYPKEVR